MGIIGFDYGKDYEAFFIQWNILLLNGMLILTNDLLHFVLKIWKLKISLIFDIE